MGNLRAFAVAVLALVACDSDQPKVDSGIVIADAAPDAKQFLDAPPPTFDFSCTGNTAPTTADAMITLGGSVQEVFLDGNSPNVRAVEGATVDACNVTGACTGMAKYGTDMTDASGGFSIGPFNTTSMPVDAYVVATKTGVRTIYAYPPAPFTTNQGMIPMLTFAPGLIQLLGLVGCSQDDVTNGMIALRVMDCANAAITDGPNLTITLKQNNAEVTGTSMIDLGSFEQMAAGTYLICNVPENATTTVSAKYMTNELRAHDVKVVKGTTTSTLLRPGY